VVAFLQNQYFILCLVFLSRPKKPQPLEFKQLELFLLHIKKANPSFCSTQFIRMIKLKRVAQMLDDTDYTVSKILYDVGFTNPSYFIKCFKQQFGVLPTQ